MSNLPSQDFLSENKRTRHDYFYFLISTRYFLNFRKLLAQGFNEETIKNFEKAQDALNTLDPEHMTESEVEKFLETSKLNDFATNLFAIRAFSSFVTVYSTLCLESLVNDYCVIRKSSSYFKKYIEKLNLVSKWLIVPKLITGNEIPPDGHAAELLGNLYEQRNIMVHPKSKKLDLTFVHELKALILQTPSHYKTIGLITQELYKIDNEFGYLEDYKWLWDKNSKMKNISEIDTLISSLMGKD